MKNVNQQEWTNLLEENSNNVVLDVRTPGECAEGIQENATQLNLLDGAEFMAGLDQLDKSKTYFVYCRSGNRSGQACEIMESNGFENTINLLGGMMQWQGKTIQP